MQQDDFFAFSMATASGMKMPRGDKDKIKTYKFPLPPLDVQKKIVEEFNDIDAQIAQAEETVKSLDEKIKTKFAALFEDKNFPLQRFVDICKDDTASGIKFQTSAYLTRNCRLHEH